jgi:hypothetical protein
MHLQECEGEQKEKNTHARLLALPRRPGPGKAGRDMVRRGDGCGCTMWAWMVHRNPIQSLAGRSAAASREGEKDFCKRSSQLLTRFFMFFITTHSPLHRTRAEGRRLQRELRPADRSLHPIIVVNELQITYDFSFQIISYILDILICVAMILLDNVLQCLMFIVVIDLSKTCGSTIILIYNNALVMFIICS